MLQLSLPHPEHSLVFIKILLTSLSLFHLIFSTCTFSSFFFSIHFSSSSYTAFPSMINFLLISQSPFIRYLQITLRCALPLVSQTSSTIKYAHFSYFPFKSHIYLQRYFKECLWIRSQNQ